MSYSSQSANMRTLAKIMSIDLGYIWGERESGPNGAKRSFHTKGRAFLSALGQDLDFTEMKVIKNYAGIAVSGEVILMGMWKEGNGLYIQLSQDNIFKTCILYRSIQNMKDYSGGRNNYINTSEMAIGDYGSLLSGLLKFKEAGNEHIAA